MANALQWVVGAGIPDLLFQDFESGVIPNGWTTVSSTPNYGFTPAIAGYGAFSLGMTMGQETRASFPFASEVFVFFVLQTALPAAQTSLLTLYNSGTTSSQYRLLINGPGTGSVLTVFDNSGVHQASGVTSLTTGIWFIWCHLKIGTGANAVLTCGYSQTLSEPTSGNSFISVASANSTLPVSSFDVGGVATTTVIDHVGVATFDMPTGW